MVSAADSLGLIAQPLFSLYRGAGLLAKSSRDASSLPSFTSSQRLDSLQPGDVFRILLRVVRRSGESSFFVILQWRSCRLGALGCLLGRPLKHFKAIRQHGFDPGSRAALGITQAVRHPESILLWSLLRLQHLRGAVGRRESLRQLG